MGDQRRMEERDEGLSEALILLATTAFRIEGFGDAFRRRMKVKPSPATLMFPLTPHPFRTDSYGESVMAVVRLCGCERGDLVDVIVQPV